MPFLPRLEIGRLVQFGPKELQRVISGWKGKYFEVLVRDRLNAGEWVGEVHLEPGQVAILAESPTQPGWDLRILNADGTVAEELQLKATESLGYVQQALERYPDIEVLTTEEAAGRAGELTGRILSSGISDQELEKTVSGPLEALLDSPLEEVLENVAPFMPFLVIGLSEGGSALVGRKSLERALASGIGKRGRFLLVVTVWFAFFTYVHEWRFGEVVCVPKSRPNRVPSHLHNLFEAGYNVVRESY